MTTKKWKNLIDKEVIGFVVNDGKLIKSQGKHFIERILPIIAKVEPNKNIKCEGVKIENTHDALLNMVNYKVKTTKNGKHIVPTQKRKDDEY